MSNPQDPASQSPNTLAQELAISPKTLRAWLRKTFPRPSVEKGTRWVLTERERAAARIRWPRYP